MPSDMLNATFAAEAAAAFNRTPASGPYTLAMSNTAIWIPLRRMSTNHAAVVDTIRDMAATADTSDSDLYLPPAYGTEPTLRAGYRAQLLVVADLLANPRTPSLESAFTTGTRVASVLLHPLSRGTVRLNLTARLQPPVLDYRSASNPIDMTLHLIHLRYLRRMVRTDTLQALGAYEVNPGAAGDGDDAALTAYVRNRTVQSYMHPCCTAAMMPRARGGVVATDLTVHGAAGLRVVDASVFPILLSAHLSATAYAVGEKVCSG